MKRIARTWVWMSVVLVIMAASCLAQSDDVSLADAARQQRKGKQSDSAAKSGSKKVVDNDSLPKDENVSVVGQATGAKTDAAMPSQDSGASQDTQAKADDKTKLTIEPDQSAGDRELIYGEWRKRIADQKDTIALLQRELDVLQREYRLRAVAMYADVGNRLRNASQWDKDDREYKDKIEAKQKDLDRAKQQLSDLQGEARKAGVPVGMID